MRYGSENPIGVLLAIAVGLCAFGAWLYVCYPATANELADESRQSWSFLVLLGFVVVAVFGVNIAGSVLQGLLVLLRSVLQLALIVAVVAGAVWLWQSQSGELPQQHRLVKNREITSQVKQEKLVSRAVSDRRWWEEKK